VPGNSGHNWVNTGLDLPAGTLVELRATGAVDVGGGWGRFGPEGATSFANVSGYPAETRFRYGLVARLTSSRINVTDDLREEWSYGELRQYCAARGGHLWLTVNDDDARNNTGEFTVVLTRGSCPSQSTRVSSPISVFTAKNRTYRRSREFVVGEPVILKVENNTPDSIFFLSIPRGAEVVRGEDVVVQRLDGQTWVNAVNNFFIDEPTIDCIELRTTMNITRSWTARLAVPGVYRLAFAYNSRRAQCTPDRRRTGVSIVYSENFQVAAR